MPTVRQGGGMGGMAMRLAENARPMMGGEGQFGSLEMGGMVTVLKVRPGLAKDDYADPNPCKHPSGTVAHLWKGVVPAIGSSQAERGARRLLCRRSPVSTR